MRVLFRSILLSSVLLSACSSGPKYKIEDVYKRQAYGVAAYYVVHPVAAQRQLVERILGYWHEGPGQSQNDFRREALSHVRVVSTMDEAIDAIHREQGMRPAVIGTSARPLGPAVSAQELRAEFQQQARPLLLVMGTGWGLTEEFMSHVDRVLEPIQGTAPYNHLSVRSATAIILDRLFAAVSYTHLDVYKRQYVYLVPRY